MHSISPVRRVSSRDFPLRQRRAAWSDLMAQFCGPVSTEFRSESPCGDVEIMDLSGLPCTRARQSDWLKAVRSERDVASADPGCLIVVAQLAGRSSVTQAQRTADLVPGDLVVTSTSLPSTLVLATQAPSPCTQLAVYVPHEWLSARSIDCTPVLARPMRTGMASIFLSLMRSVLGARSQMGVPQMDAARGALLDLLVALLRQEATPQEDATPALLLEVQDFLLRHLGDASLSAQTVARHYGVSVRQIHRLFAATGTTAGEWIRERRLERCAADLQDVCMSAAGITEVAYRWGFNDCAHFSRAFKSAYGHSPRAYRNRARGTHSTA